MLDLSLAPKPQIGLGTTTDHSLEVNKLANALKTYLLSCRVEDKSPGTIAVYQDRLTDFLHFITRNKITELNSHHIRLFLLSLKERGLAPATIDAYYRCMRTFFNWLVAEGLISQTPMSNIKKPRLPKMLVKPFTTEDIQNMILLTSGKRFVDIRNRAIILLLLDTGIRLNEVASIKLSDIDFDRETIRIFGKGSKERIVCMGKNTQKALLKYLLMRQDSLPYLWLNESRKQLTRDGIQVAIKKLCKSARVTAKPGPHTFRHTAAIMFLRNGGDSAILQYMLGHSTLEMTKRYLSTLGENELMAAHKRFSPVDGMKF